MVMVTAAMIAAMMPMYFFVVLVCWFVVENWGRV
jgi:hypothetical protein